MGISQRHGHSGRGGDGERVDYNTLKNLPPLSNKYYQNYDTTWGTSFTAGNFTITTGFKPRRIDLKAAMTISNAGGSTGTCVIDLDGTIHNGCMYQDGSFTNQWTGSSSATALIKGGTTSTAITVTAVSDTGFTLNVNNTNWNFDLLITAEG